MHLLALLIILSSCKPVTDKEPEPVAETRPPLPPGEEWIDRGPPETQADAMAEPLHPDPESAEMMGPDMVREWEAAVRFRRGEAVDYDGDGFKERVGKWVDGVFTSEFDENKDGKPDSVSDGTTKKTDLNFDGRWDVIVTVSIRPNNGQKTVEEVDEDSDGVFEKRLTIEHLSRKTQREMLERWDGEKYVVEYDEVRSTLKLMQAPRAKATPTDPCVQKMSERFPTDIDGPLVGSKGVKIPYGREEERRCSKSDARKALKAIRCAQLKANVCLYTLNPRVRARVRELLDYERVESPQSAVISCNGVCDVVISETRWRPGIAAIELPKGFANLPDNMVCEFVLHEIMHVVGIEEAWDHDEKGQDMLYSCARNCSGCSHASIGAGDDNKDCARCASPSMALKAICGTVYEATEVQIAPPRWPAAPIINGPCLKAQGSLLLSEPCADYRVVRSEFCDGTKFTDEGCCMGCSDGFTNSTPCPSWNTCQQKLPWCMET